MSASLGANQCEAAPCEWCFGLVRAANASEECGSEAVFAKAVQRMRILQSVLPSARPSPAC
eukprot:13903922-Alexandrium_andersonii.AAC.1